MAVCNTCGIELTAFNRSIGSSSCADCSRGTSPAAQRKAIHLVFARDPALDEEKLLARTVSASAPLLVGGGILAEGIYFGGVMFVEQATHGKGNTFGSLVAFAVGYAVAGALVSRSSYPLDAVRWGTFANTLAVVVAIGVVASIALGPLAAILSLPLGLGAGMLAVAMTDRARRETLRAQYRSYRATIDAARG